MSSNPYFITTPRCGGTQGVIFDDCPPPSVHPSTSVIDRIVIRYWSIVDCLEIYYSWNDGKSVTHGGSGGRRDELILGADEFITRVEGRSTDKYIVRLTFITNKRKWGPFGGAEGKRFTWGSSDENSTHPIPPIRLLYFSGSAGSFLHMLQATFAEDRELTSKTIRYENMSTPPTSVEPSTGGILAPYSKFTLHLMAPIITLYVGQEQVEFHGYEDTLCKLPFFKAALQGGFKEGKEKSINMPEDDPGKVSALIEFLYTGNYTYTYDSKEVQSQEESKIPKGDLTEGLFHIGVHVIASKYDCPGLIEITVKHIEALVDDLNDIDTLRLWKAAYAEGVRFRSREKQDFEHYRAGSGLASWVKWLFEAHPEEMELTMSEHPELACDLLRITTH